MRGGGGRKAGWLVDRPAIALNCLEQNACGSSASHRGAQRVAFMLSLLSSPTEPGSGFDTSRHAGVDCALGITQSSAPDAAQ